VAGVGKGKLDSVEQVVPCEWANQYVLDAFRFSGISNVDGRQAGAVPPKLLDESRARQVWATELGQQHVELPRAAQEDGMAGVWDGPHFVVRTLEDPRHHLTQVGIPIDEQDAAAR
jgi:hypothetical protein